MNPKPGPGRPKGSRNKRTRALIARIEGGDDVPVSRMTAPEAMLFKMRWWLCRFFGEEEKVNPDKALLEKCLDKVQEAAVAAAPYHHARLSAVVVAQGQIGQIQVTGGLPDDFDGSFVDVKRAPERTDGSTLSLVKDEPAATGWEQKHGPRTP